MRDPARIPIILEKVQEVWLAHPDMRLGQILVNVMGQADPFMVEDDVLLDDLNEWLDTSKNWSPR
jgi:hypothetical protein